MITKTAFKNYLDNGITYDTYKQNMASDGTINPDDQIKEYILLNQSRMKRVEKTYSPDERIVEQLKALKGKVFWLILSEHWCGDAAQNIPAFQKIAEMSEDMVDIKLVYRDQNDELMNAYLTNGTRSIPKLIQLDEQFDVTGTWGPRPFIAQQLVLELKANPKTAPNYSTELHLWYAKDKQRSLEKEIVQLLIRANSFCKEPLQ